VLRNHVEPTLVLTALTIATTPQKTNTLQRKGLRHSSLFRGPWLRGLCLLQACWVCWYARQITAGRENSGKYMNSHVGDKQISNNDIDEISCSCVRADAIFYNKFVFFSKSKLNK